MFGKAKNNPLQAGIRATLAGLLERTESLASALNAARAEIAILSERVATLEEAEGEARLWSRIERIERQMQVDAKEARALAQAWVDQRSATSSTTG